MQTTTKPYSQIEADFKNASTAKRLLIMKSLGHIEEVASKDKEISTWIASRIRKFRIAAFCVEEALRTPLPRVDFMKHNTGSNRIIAFSIVPSNISSLIGWHKPCACIIQKEILRQGDNNSELRWSRIIASSENAKNDLKSTVFRSEEIDSFWLTHLCGLMQTYEETRDLLHAHKEATIRRIAECGDHE
jgi:hypothetical protein